MADTCEKCGEPLEIGDFPFCPHGKAGGGALRDEIVGGITLENYGPHPITVYSHSERRRIMKERGLVEKDTFVAAPGTDKSPIGTVRWDACDAYTLEAARVLVSRGKVAVQSENVDHLVPVRINEVVETDKEAVLIVRGHA